MPKVLIKLDIDAFIETLDPDAYLESTHYAQYHNPCLQKLSKENRMYESSKIFFCICALFFTVLISSTYSDIVITCRGSERLIRILNRLGVCVCPDHETHRIYLQYRVEKIKAKGPMARYPIDVFMMVSADNLDFLHGFTQKCNVGSRKLAGMVQLFSPV